MLLLEEVCFQLLSNTFENENNKKIANICTEKFMHTPFPVVENICSYKNYSINIY